MRVHKCVSKVLFSLLILGLLSIPGLTSVKAAEKPDKPQITLTESKDGKTIKVTIHATEGADGYKIYIKGSDDAKFKALKTIKKDGSEERSFTIKKIDAGKYSIRVKAYAKVDGKTIWSSYSKAKTAQIVESKTEPVDEKKEETQEPEKEPEKEPEPEAKKYDFSSAKAGDIIQFGLYEQDKVTKNGKEPIDWIVLERNDDEIFVVSKYILDWQPYNDHFGAITWENCTLRQWLNEDFYNTAFDEEEMNAIKTTLVKNEDNPVWKTDGGNDTLDKVFLLSLADVLNPAYGFDEEIVTQLSGYAGHNSREDVSRRCSCTKYAKARGVFVWKYPTENYLTSEGETASDWWLRSVGGKSDESTGGAADHVILVQATGSVGDYGIGAFGRNNKGGDVGVRPAMWIKINP